MNYLREFLYRPKKGDRSLMARFFFADEALSSVAAELDSFDGRKDPERCASLVNKLRSCQDKLLNICNKMLEELEPGYSARLREHRAKFPDDIMTDNLAGQLWFGAECLAAGSSIMNKESESEAMRPLAKAVTKSLEKVRSLLREQVLSANHTYTEVIRENLKIFDRLFADFEYNYVSCMVHVKSLKEYDLHQDLIVLFSDTLARAIKQEMITQDVVDNYDPSLMFAIPRLAIVYGLLVCPGGPLNVDRSHSDFPSLFLPFKNLLRKIRELLQTLEPSEVMVLELLLCQLEEPANIATKLKEVERMLEIKEKSEDQALKLQAKLNGEQEQVQTTSRIQRLNSIPCQCDQKNEEIVQGVIRDIVDDVINRVMDLEIDCTQPEIRVSPRRTVEIEVVPKLAEASSAESKSNSSRKSKSSTPEVEQHSSPTTAPSRGTSAPIAFRTSRSSSSGLKRHNARRDAKRVPFKYQKDRRAKFKSTEDLIHRLYVCISGAADQLQSNYAADFRAILRVVFLINVTPDDVPDSKDVKVSPEEDLSPEINNPEENNDESEGAVQGATAEAEEQMPRLRPNLPDVDLATDALHNEMSDQLYNLIPHDEASPPNPSLGASAGAASQTTEQNSGIVYAQNLDLQLQSEQDLNNGELGEFFQPEPTLLNIADGTLTGTSPQETIAPDNNFYHRRVESMVPSSPPPQSENRRPPAWIPDAEAPNCMGCHEGFTLIKRRHHCRACGKVFCSRCSSHYIPLPHFGLDRPVRVCNRCELIINGLSNDTGGYATSPATSSSSDVLDATHENQDNEDDPRSPTSQQWNQRYYGMVS